MSSLVYFLLFLSLHACNARHLGVIQKQHLTNKFVGKAQDDETAVALKLRLSVSGKLPSREKSVAENSERKALESPSSANILKQKDSKALRKEENTKGQENKVPSSQEVSQEATITNGWKRQARSTLGSAPHDVEEAVNSKENDISEDVAVMDYAQPHRKPPIHNREP